MVRGGWNLFLAIFCMLAATNQSIHLIKACRHNIQAYTVIVDDKLSPLAKEEIKLYINSKKYKTAVNAVNDIKKHFKYIQQVEARAYPNGVVKMHVAGSNPTIIINTDYLLTSNGSITPSRRYTKNSCATLPRLYYPGRNPSNAPELIQKISQEIPIETLRTYEVSLFCKEDIRLTSPDTPLMTLQCCLKNFPDANLLLRSCKICTKELQAKTYKSIIADLRFKNQIVVTKKG